jgi:RNA methyltransferase, TrmH family
MLVKSKIKYIQSLSHKKQRDEDRLFIAEGPKIINELLNEPATRAVELFALDEWLNAHPEHAGYTTAVDAASLQRISALSTPNLVLGIFEVPVWPAFDGRGKISLLLNSIQDPGNLGTIIRCADWFGIEQVICSADCADIFNSKVVQATMGSVARVRVHYADLLETINAFTGVELFAATLNGTSIDQLDAVNEALVLIGNESRGISPELMELANKKITIQRRGKAESLNAAVATGIILHALTTKLR